MLVGRRHLVVIAAALAALSGLLAGPRIQVAANTLPRQLSDRAFWKMIAEFSEPGGSFRSDNFLSNETAYQDVIPELKKRTSPSGVYLGVGPDQNFTYIAALRPRLAFIIDIRRQNMLEHLMYKAIIEMSADRAEFLSRLFSRSRPSGLGKLSAAQALMAAYRAVPADDMLFQANLQAVLDRLVRQHGFALTAGDQQVIEYVYRAFFSEGPELRYSFPRQPGARWFPTYGELMLQTDRSGRNHSYLASEENFRILREYQRKNLLVPIVGDFGGEKAIRAVGSYLREHGATVNYFYTSNVEQYLFQNDAWRRFFASVAALPLDRHSTVIRAYFNQGFVFPPGIITPDLRSVQLLDPIPALVDAYHAGQIHSYTDIVQRSR